MVRIYIYTYVWVLCWLDEEVDGGVGSEVAGRCGSFRMALAEEVGW